MSWIEIPQDVYFALYQRLEGHFAVFGTCTHLENCSAYDARVMTEWGFKNADMPLIKSEAAPKSQMNIPKDLAEWPHKYYIYKP